MSLDWFSIARFNDLEKSKTFFNKACFKVKKDLLRLDVLERLRADEKLI